MVKIIHDNEQTKIGIQTLDYGIPADHISRFVVDFVEKNYDDLGITDDVYKRHGRYPKSIKSMIKLDIYARVNHKSDA